MKYFIISIIYFFSFRVIASDMQASAKQDSSCTSLSFAEYNEKIKRIHFFDLRNKLGNPNTTHVDTPLLSKNRIVSEFKTRWEKCNSGKSLPTDRSLNAGYVEMDQSCQIKASIYGQYFLDGNTLEHTGEDNFEKISKSTYERLQNDGLLCQAFMGQVKVAQEKLDKLKKEKPAITGGCSDNRIVIMQKDNRCNVTTQVTLVKKSNGDIVALGSFVPSEKANEAKPDFSIPLDEINYTMSSVETDDRNLKAVIPLTRKFLDKVYFADPMSFASPDHFEEPCKLLKDRKTINLPNNSYEKMNAIGHEAFLIKSFAKEAILSCGWDKKATAAYPRVEQSSPVGQE